MTAIESTVAAIVLSLDRIAETIRRYKAEAQLPVPWDARDFEQAARDIAAAARRADLTVAGHGHASIGPADIPDSLTGYMRDAGEAVRKLVESALASTENPALRRALSDTSALFQQQEQQQ